MKQMKHLHIIFEHAWLQGRYGGFVTQRRPGPVMQCPAVLDALADVVLYHTKDEPTHDQIKLLREGAGYTDVTVREVSAAHMFLQRISGNAK